MNEFLGIDLGTSSIKVMAWSLDGTIKKEKESYTAISTDGWWAALCSTLGRLDLSACRGIGLSSQVGTYLLNDTEILSWNAPAGTDELHEIMEYFSEEEWIEEICMIHPPLISYPLPRMRYFQKQKKNIKSICMPKEELIRRMTGEWISDPWSWRGLANSVSCSYSEKLLNKLGLSKTILPPLMSPFSAAGETRKIERSGKTVLPAGIPVYIGMNDFFASLAGMGIRENELFDITGTSEHLGQVSRTFVPDKQMPSGAYLNGYVHYGVTGFSGESLKFARRLSAKVETCDAPFELIKGIPPVFLPYLNGERAPIFDANAAGAFLGINTSTDAQSMAYAVMEGVVFSLYHIYETLGKPEASVMKAVGGAASNRLLNYLKAELFELPVVQLNEQDTSALGAVMTAAIGSGHFRDLEAAQKELCVAGKRTEPEGKRTGWLKERYDLYKELYPSLKESMHHFRSLTENINL